MYCSIWSSPTVKLQGANTLDYYSDLIIKSSERLRATALGGEICAPLNFSMSKIMTF